MVHIADQKITDPQLLEENTTTYWNVYYARYLILRVLVSSILLIFLVFLIKVYHRIRKGRSLMIHKEEALSAMHYIARGEWTYQYVDGKVQKDGNGNPRKLPEFDGKDHIYDLSSRELLDKIPILELFKAPQDSNKESKDSVYHEEIILELINMIKSTKTKSTKGG